MKNLNYTTLTRKQYDKIKSKAIKFEQTNHQFLCLIPCSNSKITNDLQDNTTKEAIHQIDQPQNWYELPDHSALFYQELIKPLHKTLNFDADTEDYYQSYRLGHVKIHSISNLIKNLKQLNQLQFHIIRQNSIVVIKLKHYYSDQEIQHLTDQELARRDRCNHLVKVIFSIPVFHRDLTNAVTRLIRFTNKHFTNPLQTSFGTNLNTAALKLYHEYYKISYTATQPDRLENLQTLNLLLNNVLIELQIISELKLLPLKDLISISEDFLKLQTYLSEKITKNNRNLAPFQAPTKPQKGSN